MALQTRLAAFILLLGADIKAVTDALAGKASIASNLSDLASKDAARNALIPHGTYGMIVVGGTVSDYWSFGTASITYNKLATIANNTLLGNTVGYAASPQALTAATAKTLLALNLVDNTSDAAKPVSTATQAALDAKLDSAAKAADSNLLDGIDSAQVVYGTNLNKTASITGGDMNAPFASGFYEYNSPAGAPTASWQWVINVRHSNTSSHHGFQLSNPISTNELYFRNINAGTLQAWRKFLHDGNTGDAVNYNVAISAVANTLVRRNGSGFIEASYINMTSNFTATTPSAIWIETGSDGYARKATLTSLAASLLANTTLGSRPLVSGRVISANTTLVAADAGTGMVTTAACAIACPSGIPSFEIMTVFNRSAANVTLTGTGTIRLAGTALTGTRTIGPWGLATIIAYGSTGEFWVAGPGVT